MATRTATPHPSYTFAQTLADMSTSCDTQTGLYTTLLRRNTLRKMPKATNLAISVPSAQHSDVAIRSGLTSPRTPGTPRSPPPSSAHVENRQPHFGDGYDSAVNSPINALPPPPHSPRSSKQSGGSVTAKIFGNKYASKSVTRLTSSSRNNLHESSPSIGTGTTYAHANGSSSVYLNSGAVGGANNPGSGALSGAVNKSSPDVSVSHPHSSQSSPDRSGTFLLRFFHK